MVPLDLINFYICTQKVEEEAFEGQSNRMTGVQILNAYLLDKVEAKKGGFTMIRRKVRFAFCAYNLLCVALIHQIDVAYYSYFYTC